LNVAFLDQFKDYDDSFIDYPSFLNYGQIYQVEQGTLLVYGPAYNVDWVLRPILQKLTEFFIPFQLRGGNVEYLVNRCEDGWILTIINNEGVTKKPFLQPVIDDRYQKYMEITFTDSSTSIDYVRDILHGDQPILPNDNGEYEVVIEPGDLAIFKFFTL
jgi:hypothetical protein